VTSHGNAAFDPNIQVGEWVEEALDQAAGAAARATRLAQVLRRLAPSAPVTACLLRDAADVAVIVLDQTGTARPDWGAALRGPLAALAAPGAAAALHAMVVPRSLSLGATTLEAATVAHRGRCHGVLAAAGIAPAALAAAAGQLAVQLSAEEQQREARREPAEQLRLALLGELARPVMHDLNNYLNVFLLQLAVIEAELPDRLRVDLTEIRRQGSAAAALIKQFQRYHQVATPGPVDLNRAVGEALTELQAGPPPGVAGGLAVEQSLAPGLPPVLGSRLELRWACFFLLRNAAAVLPPEGGRLCVATRSAGDVVVADFADNGPGVDEERLPHLFDPGRGVREGTNTLELAACRNIVRRLRGNLTAENLPGGGVGVRLELPAAR
jgi:signal transduction histidine kinase